MQWWQKWKADMHVSERERGRERSTYNRKQRNLACSDSDFLALIREGRRAAEVVKGSGEGWLCNTREK